MPAIRKALPDIGPSDIQNLIPDWAEDESLEFKETLSQSSSGRADPWLDTQAEIGSPAKQNLLKEVVAFANSYGGDLILGMAESSEKPPRATEIRSIPRCVDLASRLELAARDLIKPQIPMLAVRGVPIDGDAGVVIFRVPKSRLAPHRLEMKGIEKECYRRVSDRSEAMTMREIQDLTFSVARGVDHIQRFVDDVKRELTEWNELDRGAQRSIAYAIAAVPQSSELYVDKVHGVAAVRPARINGHVRLSRSDDRWFEMSSLDAPYNFRPILRGSQGEEGRADRGSRRQRVLCNGCYVDLSRLRGPPNDTPGSRSEFVIYPGWIFGSLLSTLESIEQFRVFAGAQSARYALSVSALATEKCGVNRWGDGGYGPVGAIARGFVQLPLYEVGDRDEWPELLTLIHRDFWDSIGVSDDAIDKFEFRPRR